MLGLCAGTVPLSAHAHAIHPWMVAVALSPLLAIVLAIVLGVLARSARNGATHVLLILVWVAAFWLASVYVTNDWVIWTPLVLYGIHVVVLLAVIAFQAVSRFRHARDAA